MPQAPGPVSRRRFLGGTLSLAGALPLAMAPSEYASAMSAPPASAPGGTALRRSLSVEEAAFTGAMVNALCPADALTPDGVTCGLADAIDALLAGAVDPAAYGQRALFTEGVAAANLACWSRRGTSFDRLPASDARQFLRDIAAGDVQAPYPLAAWFTDVVDPLLKQACFSGHVYETHGARVFWKMFA